ncbi:MAG: MerR family transcriptional regulator [Bacteroidia bacterium]
MPYKETEDLKLYFSIGEVAKLFNVNESLIRFWEKEFDILKPARNKKGNRLFTKEDVENLKKIFYLVKERGYTLEGAKNKLKGDKQTLNKDVELHESLMRVRTFLVELKETI